jgi:hypothetical protein
MNGSISLYRTLTGIWCPDSGQVITRALPSLAMISSASGFAWAGLVRSYFAPFMMSVTAFIFFGKRRNDRSASANSSSQASSRIEFTIIMASLEFASGRRLGKS